MKTTRWITYGILFTIAGLTWFAFGPTSAWSYAAGVASGVGLAIVYAYTDDTYYLN